MKDFALNFIFSGWGGTIIITLLSALGYKKYTTFAKELMDVPKKWREIKSKKSDGGEEITEKEKDEFIKEVVDVIEHAPLLFNKGK